MTIFRVSAIPVDRSTGTVTCQHVPPLHDPLPNQAKLLLFNFPGPGLIHLRTPANGLVRVGHIYVAGTSEVDCFKRLVAVFGNWAPERREFRQVANAFWNYPMNRIKLEAGVWILASKSGKFYPRRIA
jgi:hypothetical protein